MLRSHRRPAENIIPRSFLSSNLTYVVDDNDNDGDKDEGDNEQWQNPPLGMRYYPIIG